MDSLNVRQKAFDKTRVPLSGKLAAVSAAVMAFDAVLIMGAGFSWAMAGLLEAGTTMAWAGSGLSCALALFLSLLLLRRALRAEQEMAAKAAEPDDEPSAGSAYSSGRL